MSQDVLLEEIQEFDSKKSQRWLKILMGISLLSYLLLLIFSKEPGNNLNFTLLFLLVLAIITVVYFAKPAKLITRVTTDGITIRFQPFAGSSRFYPWDVIAEIYLREYDPIKEYYGWGIKTGPSGYAYTVSGTTGLQLVLKNGVNILIGTHCPHQLEEILRKMHKG